MRRHLLVIQHDGIDREIIVKILHMNLRYRKIFIKSPIRLENEISIYQFGPGVTIVTYKDELFNEVEVLEQSFQESGLKSKIIKDISGKIEMIEVIRNKLKDIISTSDKNKAQIVEELQLLDLGKYD